MLQIIHQFETIDNTYKEYQLIIDAHSQHINTLSKQTNLIENQGKITENRIVNQKKLYETLKILLQGITITNDDKRELKNPNLQNEGIQKCQILIE